MVKLLIVDDEKTTRDSLARYIPWSALEVGSVRTARNGLEALALCEQEPPDLLITDVRMPKLDGLRLAETVRGRYPRCKIVFLSGYADKEYLKKAISLQAVSYIEKPIDPQEVQQVARRALGLLREEEAGREEARRVREAALDGESEVRARLTRLLVGGEADAQSLRRVYGSAIPSLPAEGCCTAAVLSLGWGGGLGGGQKESLTRQVLQLCRTCRPFSLSTTFLGATDGDTVAAVLAGRIVEESPRARAGLQELLEGLRRQACGRFTAAVGVGRPARALRELPGSYEGARRAASLSFYRGPWAVLFAGAGGGERLSPGPEFFAAFQQALEDGDLEQALGLLRQLAAQAAERESLELDSVRDAFFRLLLAGVEVAWSRKLEETTCFWREIREHSSLAGLAGFVESNLRTMFAGQEAGGRCPRKIAEIRRYIRANYPRPELDLQGIAAHSGLSRTYLSHLFKEATGENLSEYITRLRVEQAKRLLRDPGLKSYEVAARVGWTDASYFAAIFRRHVGLSPTEYRQRGEG